mgnify:CR=1 FL=1|tara:strand:- start:1122 stop:2447 length:1326 start_codon:yes stop_codon:yes gene_type:complete
MSNRFIELVPTNVPSTGKISFKNGHPVIQFLIGASDFLLLGSSLRFCGDFKCFLRDGVAPSKAIRLDQLNMDCRTGIFGAIDQLVVKNVGQYSTIEHIKNYNRFMASYMPVTSASSDVSGHFGETALTTGNPQEQKSAVVNGENTTTDQNSFSVHLPCGLFLGQQPIFIGEQGINGILIELHLTPDNQFFHSMNGVLQDSGSGKEVLDNAYYEFSNLKLTAELIQPDQQTMSSLMGKAGSTYQYNSISSYYTSINSANAIVNFNLGLRNVLGCWANFIEAKRINNFQYNGLETRWLHNSDNSPAYIKTLIFTKGGVKFPENYDTQTIQKDAPTNTFADPSVLSGFMNAITQFSKMSRTMVSPNNTYQNSSEVDTEKLDGGQIAGVGIAYDQVSGQGVDMSTQNFGIRMDCNLITDNPTGLYLFVHSKQTLVFNGSGLQILK